MSISDTERRRLHDRTLNVLRVGVVPGQAAIAGVVAVSTLLAKDLLGGNERLAGLGSAAFTLGGASIAIPLAAFMRRRGRRPGLVAALAAGAFGAAVAAVGGQADSFWLFVAGMFVFGAGQAAGLQARYVAADLADENQRARSIAAIVWISTLGAVFGPVFTPVEDRFGQAVGLDPFVGPYFFAAAFFAIGAVYYAVFLRPDPLVVIGATDPNAQRRRPIAQVRASIGLIKQSPAALLGLVAMAVSQGAMVGVMTMTPPHMGDHNHAEMSAYVIALHIVGMYGFAPLVGRFVARVGEVKAIQYGAVILGAGTITAVVAGYVPVLVFVGLFLLGVGWNVGLIAGTTLLTNSVPERARVEAQGTGDLTLSLCGAVAAFGSGFIKHMAGYHMLANTATALAGAILVYAWLVEARTRAAGEAA